MAEKYKTLSPGKKRQLRDKYTASFGFKPVTFYQKLKGRLKLMPIEQKFFTENLV
jgi:hypothetical protein